VIGDGKIQIASLRYSIQPLTILIISELIRR